MTATMGIWESQGKDIVAFIKGHPCMVLGDRRAEGAQLGKDALPKVGPSWFPHAHTEEPHGECWPPKNCISMKPFG